MMMTTRKMGRGRRFIARTALAFVATGALAVPASGAPPTPSSAGSDPWAANVEMGFTNQTGDGNFDAHALLGASLEKYQTQNVSWRGAMSMHSFGDPAFQQPFRTVDDEDVLALNGNILYHWVDNDVQPFVTGGLGYYSYQRSFDNDHSELGVDFGGGVDFVTAPAIAIKIEALYHKTTAAGNDRFVAGTAGVRFRW